MLGLWQIKVKTVTGDPVFDGTYPFWAKPKQSSIQIFGLEPDNLSRSDSEPFEMPVEYVSGLPQVDINDEPTLISDQCHQFIVIAVFIV